MKFYLILCLVFATLFGAAYLVSRNKNVEEELAKDQAPLSIEGVEGCKFSKDTEETYVQDGSVDFIVKEGVTPEELEAGILSVGLDFHEENLGYLDLDGAKQLYLIYDEENKNELAGLLEPFFEGLDFYDAEQVNMDFSAIRGNVTFSWPLSDAQKESIEEELDLQVLSSKLNDFGWFDFPPVLETTVPVPYGEEEKYIEALKETELFSCVGYDIEKSYDEMPLVQ